MSVKVTNLTKVYGTQRAVDDLSFEIKKGEIVGFLGPNGAGKSTTMKILTCFIPQTSGTAEVCGFDTATQPLEVTRKIGYLPESNPLYHDMYVREYLEFMAGLQKLGKLTKSRIDEMIEVTGLTQERKKKIGQLSKGYKQRVGIAQALLHDPEVLILDEHTSGLDPNQLVEIRALVKKLGESKTVIFSSHILPEVEAIADRVIMIRKGKKVADASLQDVLSAKNGERSVVAEFGSTIDKATLEAIKGIKRLEGAGGKWKFVTEANRDIRSEVFNLAKEKGITLLGLQKEELNLEDVFRELTK
ncbi:MAG: gliding motility-associated ABC transporter ATP-binding subunit GldA [Chitinophagales bacterium]